jgi:hypothetical protein
MLFGKSKDTDKSAKKRDVTYVDPEPETTRKPADDVLTERLFEDAPSSARGRRAADEGLIIDIEPDAVIPAPKATPAAQPKAASPVRGWFSRTAPKPAAAKPKSAPIAAKPVPSAKVTEILPDDLLFDEDPVADVPAKAAPAAKAASTPKAPESNKPSRSWYSGFGRRTAASKVTVPKAEKAAPPKAPAPKKDSPLVVPPTTPAAKKTAPKQAKRGSGPVDPYIVLEIGGSRTLIWQLMEQGLETRDEVPVGASAISFAATDLRFAVEGAISNRKADTLAVESTGEPVYLINRSKDLGAIYASNRLRFSELTYRPGPGALVLETLHAPDSVAEQPAILGFQLKDAADKDAVVILYYRAPSGELGTPQISIYPDNLEFVLSQFATANQLRADFKLVLFDNAALRRAAATLVLYPNQPSFGAVSSQTAWRVAATVAVVAALGTGAWAGYEYRSTAGYAGELAQLKQHDQRAKHEAQELLESSSVTLARELSLPLDTALARSQALWVPGARVSMTVDGDSSDYTVLLPLNTKLTGHSLIQPTAELVVEQLRTLAVPTGCQRNTFNFSGALNEVTLTIHCQDTVSTLSRYRGR